MVLIQPTKIASFPFKHPTTNEWQSAAKSASVSPGNTKRVPENGTDIVIQVRRSDNVPYSNPL